MFLPRCMECRKKIADRSSDENPVGRSVCPSVKRVNCDKTEEKLGRFLYHAKDHLVYFMRKRMAGEGDSFYLSFWVNGPLLERNRRL